MAQLTLTIHNHFTRWRKQSAWRTGSHWVGPTDDAKGSEKTTVSCCCGPETSFVQPTPQSMCRYILQHSEGFEPNFRILLTWRFLTRQIYWYIYGISGFDVSCGGPECLIRNWWPTRCKFWFIYLYPNGSTCFGRCFRPSSGALDCIYSFWYNPPILLTAGVMDEMERSLYLYSHLFHSCHCINIMCYSLWYNGPTMLPATGRQHLGGCIIPQAVTHSLVFLKMGKIISRNMLSWLELLISRYCCI